MPGYESDFEEYDEIEFLDDGYDDVELLGVRADQPPGAKTPGLGIKWWQVLILLAGLGAVGGNIGRTRRAADEKRKAEFDRAFNQPTLADEIEREFEPGSRGPVRPNRKRW